MGRYQKRAHGHTVVPKGTPAPSKEKQAQVQEAPPDKSGDLLARARKLSGK